MKKIILIILLILTLISCESNIDEKNNINKNNQEVNKNKSTDSNNDLGDDWFIGKINNKEKLSLRYEIIEGEFYGEYSIDSGNKIINLKGYLSDNVYYINGTDGTKFIISLKVKDKILGIIEKDNKRFPFYCLKGDNEKIFPKLDLDKVISLENTYISDDSTMFIDSSINITPVFNELIYVEISAKNGTHTGEVSFYAYKKEDEYIADIKDLKFIIKILGDNKIRLVTDRISRVYNCGSDVSYDEFYSDNTIIKVYDGIELALSESEEELNIFKNLVGENYDNLLYFSQYHIIESINDYKLTTFSIVGYPDTYKVMKKDNSIYIALPSDITSFEKGVVYTNNTKSIPYEIEKFLSFDYDVNKKKKTKLENSIKLVGKSINDFVLDGWEIKDKIVGKLNDDEKEDIVLVVDKLEINDIDRNRLLILLINNGDGYDLLLSSETALLGRDNGGVWGDPYDYINIEDNNLVISFYGGSSYRWGYTYTFDISRKFQLVKIFEIEHSTITFEGIERTTNLIKNIITTVKYDSDENKIKDEEEIDFSDFRYLNDFNIFNNINSE